MVEQQTWGTPKVQGILFTEKNNVIISLDRHNCIYTYLNLPYWYALTAHQTSLVEP